MRKSHVAVAFNLELISSGCLQNTDGLDSRAGIRRQKVITGNLDKSSNWPLLVHVRRRICPSTLPRRTFDIFYHCTERRTRLPGMAQFYRLYLIYALGGYLDLRELSKLEHQQRRDNIPIRLCLSSNSCKMLRITTLVFLH